MENQKPGSIKNIGLIIAILSAMIMLSNTMGAFMLHFLGVTGRENTPSNPMEFIMHYFNTLCFCMVMIGGMYLIGGVYLRKYKLWANRLVSVTSVLLIFVIWGLMLAMSITFMELDKSIALLFLINALFWSTPLMILIFYLNKKKIRQHFS